MITPLVPWMTPVVGDAESSSFWMPPQASDFSIPSDALFDFILYLSIFFFVVMMYFTAVWAWKYRVKEGETRRTSPVHHNFKLEFLWSAIPTVLLVVIFAWGFKDYTALSATPADAVQIRIIGQKWNWTMQYPKLNKECADRIVVPAGKPFTVTMSSQDVIHSFWIPAMRVKRDVLPFRYTGFTVTPLPEAAGMSYPFMCAEYCGNKHSNMIGTVEVLSPEDFDAWVASNDCPGIDPDAPDYGERLFVKLGCTSCHSVDSSKARVVGPPLFGLFGTTEPIAGGEPRLVDENYLRESIEYPEKAIVAGYEGENMPAFRGRVDEKALNALVDYIKGLKE